MSKELNLLLVNNGSDSLSDYYDMLSGHTVNTVLPNELRGLILDNYDLIVLSDGFSINVKDNDQEIQLVKHAKIPLIGICYGFQLLCYVYGSDLLELDQRRDGVVKIFPKEEHPIFSGKDHFLVFEKHKYAVKNVSSGLICLANSEDGCEIVQVRDELQFGLQFHPERKDENPDGGLLLTRLLDHIAKTVKVD